jgi:hypothetical protein
LLTLILCHLRCICPLFIIIPLVTPRLGNEAATKQR